MSSYPFALFEWPRWAQMWALALAIYIACKWLTWLRTTAPDVPVWKHAAYLLAWPGMDAAGFLEEAPISHRAQCRSTEWLAATGKLTFGVALLFGVARMIHPRHEYVIGWIGMIGIAYRFLFRPCASWFGPRWGILAGLSRLHRQMYWVYGGYVVLSIVAFATLSIFNSRELASGSGLARGFCAYVAVFWSIRVGLQFVFDVKEHLIAWWLKVGYFVLTIMFTMFTIVYAWAAF